MCTFHFNQVKKAGHGAANCCLPFPYSQNKAKVASRNFYQDATAALVQQQRYAARVFLLLANKQAEFLGDIQIDQQDINGLATENTEEFAPRVLFDDIFQMIF